MKQAIDETARRRALQGKYNEEHGITPATIVRAVMHIDLASGTTDYVSPPKIPKGTSSMEADVDVAEKIQALRLEMFTAAENLDFETAARIRDDLKRLEGGIEGATVGATLEGPYDPYARKKGAAKKSAAPKKASPAARKRATGKWKPR
jgi:excinuclease ABC subunit B